jgi:hypothetical protein
MRTPRAYGRGSVTSRHEKAKARGSRHQPVSGSTLERNHVATAEEVVEKTLKRLHTLGSQRFASSPYSEHFDRWLMNLTDVLSEFESSPNINVDDQFLRECSRILSNVELALKERRRVEASLEEALKGLSASKSLLARIKADYASKAREIRVQKSREIRRLNSDIGSLREELVDVARMKTGLFRGISKKDRDKKETETTQEVDTRQRKLELAMLEFTFAEERLQDEYERKRQPIIEQIKDRQKKIENLETDGSLEDRWFACEALLDAVNALLQRKKLSHRRSIS